jgi:hypothetical protein
MRLNHLDLQAHDIQRLATFLVDNFDLERLSNETSPAICILHDREGFTLVLQRRTDEAPYPAGFHIGFIHARADAVHIHHARLVAAGLAPGPIDINARGTRFYVHAPEHLLVEVSSPQRS